MGAGTSQSGFFLVNTTIKVEGVDIDGFYFYDLLINQALADVNSFSFTWRQPEGEASLQAHISFYQKNLSKEVTINIDNNFTFKGLITGIDCLKQDVMGTQYSIKGKGLFVKLDEAIECNSFVKMNINEIFKTLNTSQGLKLSATAKNSKALFYTVQYNQTVFEFYKLMAARYGEWLYYDGGQMVLGPPSKEAIKLRVDQDINDITISAQVRKASVNTAGFDTYKGEALAEKKPAPSASSSGLVAASIKGGESMYGNSQAVINMSHAANKEVLDGIIKLQQQAALASTVSISGHSYNSKVKLGVRIKLEDDKGGAAGEYIITQIQHSCPNNNQYENQFTAVPAELEVPPYTNPYLFTQCKPQPALVVKNEDRDGLDRIKVRFPWQKTSETPWLNVLTPHAGKDKGFRFLPEVGEEVLIGFIDNNAERPFMMGAVHTEKNKSANKEAGNNLKSIGTRTGRRLEINDEEGAMLLYDNYTDKTPKNALLFERKDSKLELMLQSQKSDQAFSVIAMKNEEYLNLGVMSGGTLITEIKLEKAGQKITIKSAGSVEVNADKKITMSAPDIEINASNELKLSGSGKGVVLKGMKVALTADSTMEVKGVQTTVEGSAKLDLKAGALASLAGALVKIN